VRAHNLIRLTANCFLVCAGISLWSAYAEQSYVTRYDAFAGYSYLSSPKISLTGHGVQLQAGYRPRTWYSIGFDYSNFSGDLTLTPNLLPTELQQSLGKQLAYLAAVGKLPAGYSLVVPASSRTQTFALGPQLAFRHWEKTTLFVRPSLGAIYEEATPQPGDPIAKAIVAGLAPDGRRSDWQGFYGVGGGFDINVNKHFAVRFQADWGWDHLFNDLLAEGRQTVRFSIGPAFNFGRNIKE